MALDLQIFQLTRPPILDELCVGTMQPRVLIVLTADRGAILKYLRGSFEPLWAAVRLGGKVMGELAIKEMNGATRK